MMMIGVKFVDAFSDSAWKDANPGINPIPLHMVLPFVPPLKDNKRLLMAVTAVKKFMDMIDVPILVNVMPPHPRYLNNPCCINCMPIWDKNLSPMQHM